MSEDKMAIRWIPVSRGAKYCSPGCGRGCLKSEYMDAHNKAQLLCTELGQGWVPNVWENLGWHYSVRDSTGSLEVFPSTPHSSYSAYFTGEQQFTAYGKTPASAVKNVVTEAKKTFNGLKKQLALLVPNPF